MAKVRINTSNLFLRNAPYGAIIGFAYWNSTWEVTGIVQDADGKNWLQSGPTVFMAEWLTVPVIEVPAGNYSSPVGTAEERASGEIWPGYWFDALPFMFRHSNGSYHTGADLNLNTPTWNADKGAPVYSMSDGVVTFAEEIPGTTWGNVVIVEHGPSLYSRYAHLETVNVVEGQNVVQGEQLGTIGTMPGYEGYQHLHFDISNTGVLKINPGHWPGLNRNEVMQNYVNPRQFLLDTQG